MLTIDKFLGTALNHEHKIVDITGADSRYLQIANNLSDLSNAATARTNLGVAIGSDVQAWDANLDQIAALAPTADNFIVGNGSAWALETPSDARTSLGLVAGGGGDIWVEKAGDTMTGALNISLATGNSLIVDTNTFVVDASNNRVGIGTSSPESPLHVIGTGGIITVQSVATDSTVKSGGLNLGHFTNSEEKIVVFGGTSTNTASIIVFGGGAAALNAATEVRFITAATNTTLTGTNRMIINSSGFVGIGSSTTVSHPLQVNPDAFTTAISSQARVLINNTNAITTNTGNTGVFSVIITEPNITVGTATPTNAATLYIVSAPTEATNNYSLWVDAGTSRFDGRILGAQGAGVASANDLTLGNGNVFEITGTTQINAITTTDWQNGSVVTLLFTSTPTVKHNTAGGAGTAVLLLAGAADFAATAGDTLTLVLSEIGGTQAWREVSRAVI